MKAPTKKLSKILIKRFLVKIFIIFALCAVIVSLPLIFPGPLFSYSVEQGSLSVHSDKPIPDDQARRFLKEVKQRLDQSPLQPGNTSMQIYVANSAWRRRWLWIVPPSMAGGFIAAPVTRSHAFFSGADFETDELISPSGYRTQPPRTLSYFGAHELTHIVTYKKLGWIRFYLMPEWIREGLADYVAMPEESAASLFEKIGTRDSDLDMMKAHGVYAPYRLLVAYLLEDEGWPVEKLLASKLSLDEVRAIVFKSLDLN